ncbi:hypothetical protein BS50DRAFT_568219 [Corynespora cassiicola Philippines]|uniref:Rhodopsin domain-containing protein n=1 Tax=Corynespora cassiicola Philippines TaxID=1448308 RepID=A0A2T2PD86_CORCC|nr:hypothetical protein BS50DRAFT_568219 [Corynespora cassiicola Philippines]
MTSPAAPPMPDLGPDVDRGANVAATYIVGCSVSFIFVLLRFWARYQIRALAIDDWCMLVTWIPFVPLTVLTCQLVLSGGTRHLPYLAAEDPENLAHLIKTNWIAQPFGIFCLGMGKVAISLLLVRLLQRAAKWRKWFLHGLSIWTVLNTICMIVLTFVQCEDVRALWQQELKATVKCWDPSVQSNFSIYGSSAFSLVDFVLAFMPLTLIWGLQLDLKKKIGLAVLLCCGALTGVCAAVKTSKLVSLASRSDLTWETYDLYIWTGVEIVLLIVCGSVPALKPLYDLALGKKNRSTSGPSYKLSAASTTRTPSEHYQPEYQSNTPLKAISVTRTFDASSREGSDV